MGILPKGIKYQKKVETKAAVFTPEKYFFVEDFCNLAGYEESFVREVIENCDDFIAFVIEGKLVIPKNAEYSNRLILNRVYTRLRFDGIL
ncbi:hypothetical protein [Priestia sp. YIM B13486]|uniref:hypothetical protein n=1 Tax=Priestia sp. YIM B13486 TaxID=3366304 RepID=UPI00366C97B2